MAEAVKRRGISLKQAFVGVMVLSMLMALIVSWIITTGLVGRATAVAMTQETYITDSGQVVATRQGALPQAGSAGRIIATFTPLAVFLLASFLAAFVFYRWKLRTPLALLKAATQRIRDRDLDFVIRYDAHDEMGGLARAFEDMRCEVYNSLLSEWRAQEDRRVLDQAFAHDVRTPLTVLKGQVDVLLRNVESDTADKQKVLSTLGLLRGHIGRLEQYADEIGALQRLEDIPVSKKETDWDAFLSVAETAFSQLAGDAGRTIRVKRSGSADSGDIDEAIVMRVLENIITNAVRHAATTVRISFDTSDRLAVDVVDDGPGFSPAALRHALEPFFHDEAEGRARGGIGLGLYIAKVLAEKHGGSITIANAADGGGRVTVVFEGV